MKEKDCAQKGIKQIFKAEEIETVKSKGDEV